MRLMIQNAGYFSPQQKTGETTAAQGALAVKKTPHNRGAGP